MLTILLTLMLQVNPPDTPEEWGVVSTLAFLVVLLTGTLVWFAKSARQDLRESHKQFIAQGERQTEAAIATAKAIEATTRATEASTRATEASVRSSEINSQIVHQLVLGIDRHEKDSERRYLDLIERIERMN